MEEIKIYQQIDWNGFHIGTSDNEEWFINKMGALDVEAIAYNSEAQKTKWVDEVWVVKNIEEWE